MAVLWSYNGFQCELNGASHNCPSLKLYGYSTERGLHMAINRAAKNRAMPKPADAPKQIRKIAVMNADPSYSEIWEESDGKARWYERGRLVRTLGDAKQIIEQIKAGEWLARLVEGI